MMPGLPGAPMTLPVFLVLGAPKIVNDHGRFGRFNSICGFVSFGRRRLIYLRPLRMAAIRSVVLIGAPHEAQTSAGEGSR